MLLKCPFAVESRTPVWWRWAAALTMAVASLAASCLTLRDLGGWTTEQAMPPSESPREFRIPQLVIGQGENEDQAFDLRFRLPDQFHLSFEILAEPHDLPALQVLGHKLGPALDPGGSSGAYRLWHQVRIQRTAGAEEIEVDGKPVADSSRMPKLFNLALDPRAPGTHHPDTGSELTW